MADNPDKEAHQVSTVTVDPKHPRSKIEERLVLGKKIGEGGMAEILLAEDRNLRRTMAVKRLRWDQPKDDLRLGRLIGEAQVVAQLDHPNIVPVHDLAEDPEGNLYYTMKLVHGEDLGQIIEKQDHRFRTQDELFELMQVFIKVCDALSFAHSRGIIHRDVKPENIMVGEYGEVYLMDWGLALPMSGEETADSNTKRYTVVPEEKIIVGTPGFMSPEQARAESETLDGGADIFSLGALLYYFITGEPPVEGATPVHVIFNTIHGDIRHPAEVVDHDPQPELCRITMKALAKDRGERYARVEDLKRDLELFMRRGWQPLVRTYQPGDPIIKEGDPGHEAYIITDGKCRVFKAHDGVKEELRIMGEGEAFGEIALFADLPRTASVEAVGEVRLMVISRNQLETEIGGSYFLGRFLKSLAGRFVDLGQKQSTHLEEVRRRDLAVEVMCYLAGNGKDLEGRREAPWSPLKQTLTARFGWSGDHLTELVRGIDRILVNEPRDIIAVTKQQTAVWG